MDFVSATSNTAVNAQEHNFVQATYLVVFFILNLESGSGEKTTREGHRVRDNYMRSSQALFDPNKLMPSHVSQLIGALKVLAIRHDNSLVQRIRTRRNDMVDTPISMEATNLSLPAVSLTFHVHVRQREGGGNSRTEVAKKIMKSNNLSDVIRHVLATAKHPPMPWHGENGRNGEVDVTQMTVGKGSGNDKEALIRLRSNLLFDTGIKNITDSAESLKFSTAKKLKQRETYGDQGENVKNFMYWTIPIDSLYTKSANEEEETTDIPNESNSTPEVANTSLKAQKILFADEDTFYEGNKTSDRFKRMGIKVNIGQPNENFIAPRFSREIVENEIKTQFTKDMELRDIEMIEHGASFEDVNKRPTAISLLMSVGCFIFLLMILLGWSRGSEDVKSKERRHEQKNSQHDLSNSMSNCFEAIEPFNLVEKTDGNKENEKCSSQVKRIHSDDYPPHTTSCMSDRRKSEKVHEQDRNWQDKTGNFGAMSQLTSVLSLSSEEFEERYSEGYKSVPGKSEELCKSLYVIPFDKIGDKYLLEKSSCPLYGYPNEACKLTIKRSCNSKWRIQPYTMYKHQHT